MRIAVSSIKRDGVANIKFISDAPYGNGDVALLVSNQTFIINLLTKNNELVEY